jgi:hypothetical protein
MRHGDRRDRIHLVNLLVRQKNSLASLKPRVFGALQDGGGSLVRVSRKERAPCRRRRAHYGLLRVPFQLRRRSAAGEPAAQMRPRFWRVRTAPN